jgi:hypothetical protein
VDRKTTCSYKAQDGLLFQSSTKKTSKKHTTAGIR